MTKNFEWPNEISLPVFYANRQWAVTSYGIECLTEEYAIERSRLCERYWRDSRLSDWIMHLCEKQWCDIREFANAFAVALFHNRVKGRTLIDVRESLNAALREQSADSSFADFCEGIGLDGNYMAGDLIAAGDLYKEANV